jgi:hypothetical protein
VLWEHHAENQGAERLNDRDSSFGRWARRLLNTRVTGHGNRACVEVSVCCGNTTRRIREPRDSIIGTVLLAVGPEGC